MRLLSLLEDERKSGTIWYVLCRQSPYPCDPPCLHARSRLRRRVPLVPHRLMQPSFPLTRLASSRVNSHSPPANLHLRSSLTISTPSSKLYSLESSGSPIPGPIGCKTQKFFSGDFLKLRVAQRGGGQNGARGVYGVSRFCGGLWAYT
jgi:hypothetical protein